MLNLNQIKENKEVKVINLTLLENFTRRILDIGIIPGVIITKVLNSPFKKISAYDINGTLIAIRDEDAKKIEVEYV